MLKDTTVISFRQPDAIDDPLTDVSAGAKIPHWSGRSVRLRRS